jgi:hypothetical protein
MGSGAHAASYSMEIFPQKWGMDMKLIIYSPYTAFIAAQGQVYIFTFTTLFKKFQIS